MTAPTPGNMPTTKATLTAQHHYAGLKFATAGDWSDMKREVKKIHTRVTPADWEISRPAVWDGLDPDETHKWLREQVDVAAWLLA